MNELTKIIFDKLGVEPNEEFNIKCYTNPFTISNDLQLYVKDYNFNGDFVKWEVFDITNLILGKDKIIKIPKPLITEEEKQFFEKFEDLNGIELENSVLRLYFDLGDVYLPIHLDTLKHKFSGLENGKYYSPKELGL